ncbi:MAG: hypothetical protein M3445_07400 [Actinomycetota bacterium]|nr:hypothetical protein [Actinomycetota bacterium]
MEQNEVLAILAALEATGTRLWVAGGWGVDALVGRQTRARRDLDLLLDAQRLEATVAQAPPEPRSRQGFDRPPLTLPIQPSWFVTDRTRSVCQKGDFLIHTRDPLFAGTDRNRGQPPG